MMELIYSDQRGNFEPGRHYENPRYFNGTVTKGVSHVYVMGDWPKVVAAYEEEGVNVTILKKGAPISYKDGLAPVEPGAEEIEIPETWQRYGAPRVIALANEIAQREDITTRKDAVKVIEAELDRRAKIMAEDMSPDGDE